MEAIGTLAGGIAHDFNNILAGIIGFAELAQHDALVGSEIENYLKLILQAGNRAKLLVSQILSFSRLNVEVKSQILIKPIVREVIQLLRASLSSSIEIKSIFGFWGFSTFLLVV